MPDYTGIGSGLEKQSFVRYFLFFCLIQMPLISGLTFADTASTEHENESRQLYFVLLSNESESRYWQLADKAAKAAADDLNIRLDIIPLNSNPLRPVRALESLLSANQKPDAVIFSNLKHTGHHVLKLLERHHVYSMIFENGFSLDDQISAPGKAFHYWHAQLLSGNELASRRVTQELIERGLQADSLKPPLSIIALEGLPGSDVNNQRLLGLKKTIQEYGHLVELEHIFPTRWQPESAREAVLSSIRRFPNLSLIWTANDDMAISAVEAVTEMGKFPGENIFITGFDLTPEAVKHIESGHIVNSYGGHYMSAAWSLIYMYDFFHGFNQTPMSMQISLISQRHEWQIPFEDEMRRGFFSRIDFRIFSKQFNDNKDYPFLTLAQTR